MVLLKAAFHTLELVIQFSWHPNLLQWSTRRLQVIFSLILVWECELEVHKDKWSWLTLYLNTNCCKRFFFLLVAHFQDGHVVWERGGISAPKYCFAVVRGVFSANALQWWDTWSWQTLSSKINIKNQVFRCPYHEKAIFYIWFELQKVI